MLIINHGDRYYSLYAHASELFTKVGETISEGQIIGKVGDTGSIRGPILYFEIRYRGEPQDPLAWLRKNRISVIMNINRRIEWKRIQRER